MNTAAPSPLDTLAAEHGAVLNLIELIKQEQTHLVEANIDGLANLTTQKAQLVAQMAELASKRHIALEKAGFAPQDASMQSWLGNPGHGAASKIWSEILLQVASAKELNRINGLLISKHMARNQTALNILHTAPQSGNFYGPNGQSTVKISTRSLVVG